MTYEIFQFITNKHHKTDLETISTYICEYNLLVNTTNFCSVGLRAQAEKALPACDWLTLVYLTHADSGLDGNWPTG